MTTKQWEKMKVKCGNFGRYTMRYNRLVAHKKSQDIHLSFFV